MTMKQGARLAGLLLVIALAVWALYLLIVGLPHIRFAEVQPGEPLPPGQIIFRSYTPALYSLFALLLIAIGLLRDKWLPLAWAGVILHFVFGGLLIWSMGIFYIAAAGVFAVQLGILQSWVKHRTMGLTAAWIGAAVVLVIGVLLTGTASGVYILAAGILLGMMLAGLQ